MGYLPRGQSLASSITFILLIANVAVFIVTLAGGEEAVLILAQTGELFYAGFLWQPFTAMFVHFDILHILFNMFALVYFGTVVEGSYTRSQYLTIYFGAGLLGNLASLFSSLSTTRPAEPRGRSSVSWGRTWRWRGRAPASSWPRSTPY